MSRPLDFVWDTPKVQGETVIITANEWNNFTNRINEFRVYKGLTDYSFTNVTTGMNISALIFNEARNAIYDIFSTIVPIISSGSPLYSNYFNQLVTDLNSIV